MGRFEGGGRSPRAHVPKLHIKPFKQLEGSSTFTKFIEPLLSKKRTEQPCRQHTFSSPNLSKSHLIILYLTLVPHFTLLNTHLICSIYISAWVSKQQVHHCSKAPPGGHHQCCEAIHRLPAQLQEAIISAVRPSTDCLHNCRRPFTDCLHNCRRPSQLQEAIHRLHNCKRPSSVLGGHPQTACTIRADRACMPKFQQTAANFQQEAT